MMTVDNLRDLDLCLSGDGMSDVLFIKMLGHSVERLEEKCHAIGVWCFPFRNP